MLPDSSYSDLTEYTSFQFVLMAGGNISSTKETKGCYASETGKDAFVRLKFHGRDYENDRLLECGIVQSSKCLLTYRWCLCEDITWSCFVTRMQEKIRISIKADKNKRTRQNWRQRHYVAPKQWYPLTKPNPEDHVLQSIIIYSVHWSVAFSGS
jgi:hypothetical protein